MASFLAAARAFAVVDLLSPLRGAGSLNVQLVSSLSAVPIIALVVSELFPGYQADP
jgi:hypothetical protein